MVACSTLDGTVVAERVLRAGAMGYVNKQEPAEKILDAIRGVVSGLRVVHGTCADRVFRRLAGSEDRSE